MRIAIMQPYFAPYAGYFELIRQTDLFVILDCVQYQRRGWIHRNRILNNQQQPVWVTLPIEKAPMNTPISQMKIQQRFPLWLKQLQQKSATLNKFAEHDPKDFNHLFTPHTSLCDFIENSLQFFCRHLNLPFNTIRASAIDITPGLTGESLILAICQQLGAKQYLNASGGTQLYHAKAFARHNIELAFLPKFQGSSLSILQDLLNRYSALPKSA